MTVNSSDLFDGTPRGDAVDPVSAAARDAGRHLAIQDRAAEIMIAGPIVFLTPYTVYNTEAWNGLGSPNGLVGMDWTMISPKE
jgi:hypothetical protein